MRTLQSTIHGSNPISPIDNRMESLKGYPDRWLQILNVSVRKDIPVSSSVRGFQIWTVVTGDNEFNVTYSVDQLITEEKIQRPSTLLI